MPVWLAHFPEDTVITTSHERRHLLCTQGPNNFIELLTGLTFFSPRPQTTANDKLLGKRAVETLMKHFPALCSFTVVRNEFLMPSFHLCWIFFCHRIEFNFSCENFLRLPSVEAWKAVGSGIISRLVYFPFVCDCPAVFCFASLVIRWMRVKETKQCEIFSEWGSFPEAILWHFEGTRTWPHRLFMFPFAFVRS